MDWITAFFMAAEFVVKYRRAFESMYRLFMQHGVHEDTVVAALDKLLVEAGAAEIEREFGSS